MKLHNSVFSFLVLVISSCSTTLIETFWESTQSWETNGGLWHVPLAGIKVGEEGSTEGVNVVTVAYADTCAEHCQEDYPDEFCSRYPPEGVPEQSRTVDDWGTKFNRTSQLLAEGIQEIQKKGGKVRLAYGGGEYPGVGGYGNLGGKNGDMPQTEEDCITAKKFAERVKSNVDAWGFDGVDFTQGQGNCLFTHYPGLSASFHYEVIKHTRQLLGPEKSISYTILYGAWGTFNGDLGEPYEAVIFGGLRYLDYVTVVFSSWDENLVDMLLGLGIPSNKLVVGITAQASWMNMEEAAIVAENIKAKGLRGLMIFSANQEYMEYQGQLLGTVVNVINGN